MDTIPPGEPAKGQPALGMKRDEDAIYQKGELVGRVLEPQVHSESKEINFLEIYNSDHLLLPDECEFQSYRIVVRKIGYATKVEKESLHKGRILREVKAEILGYREQ